MAFPTSSNGQAVIASIAEEVSVPNETGQQRRDRQRDSIRQMLEGPIEDVYIQIEGNVGPVETAKAVINARAIAEAAQAGLADSKALVQETKRLVGWTRGLVFATIGLVIVDLVFQLVDYFSRLGQ